LWEGNVDCHGRFFTAKATLTHRAQVPLLISALGAGAFRLAGEVADGAISWNCPVAYLLDTARPAMDAGAAAAGRPVPSLVAHVWVALSDDLQTVRAAAKQALGGYARLPFYANMFASAGYPVQADGQVPDGLIDALVVMGNPSAVAARLESILGTGVDEVLLTHVALGNPASERRHLIQFVSQL
jgi:alkanesulfonate monooxygenase SsuD/methylene tetrahydromethanopterin reductase-like flavin-dependent oxidoreductase (luciferase family)